MCAIQQISAQIGRVTGHGLGRNLRCTYPSWALDVPTLLYVAGFGALSVEWEIFIRYSQYVSNLK